MERATICGMFKKIEWDQIFDLFKFVIMTTNLF